MSYRPAVLLTLVALGMALHASPGARMARDDEDCIQTPTAFLVHWDAFTVPTCISSSLYGVLKQPSSTPDSSYPYPSSFLWAWAFTHDTLMNFLTLRRRFGKDDMNKVVIAMRTMIGTPHLKHTKWTPALAVFTLPRFKGVFSEVRVPTISSWVHILGELGHVVPSNTHRELLWQYSSLNLMQQTDAVDTVADLIGCTKRYMLDENSPDGSALSFKDCEDTPAFRMYRNVFDTLMHKNPHFVMSGTNGEMTVKCFDALFEKFPNPTTVQLRTGLMVCQDSSFLNTGLGLTYNTYANPLLCGTAYEQRPKQRYQGAEVIVLNRPMSDFSDFREISLPSLPEKPQSRNYLQEGFNNGADWCINKARGD